LPIIEAKVESIHVMSWCPTPTPTVPPTQVHLALETELGLVIVRFKGERSLDKLIAALEEHRTEVFGARATPVEDYEATIRAMTRRIRALAVTHPEVLECTNCWDLFKVSGFHANDLAPSTAQAATALIEAKKLGPLREDES
jgi:hypothetical protein